MNKVFNSYIIYNYLKIILNCTLVFFCMCILLNLFQEIEFFKDTGVNIQKPLILTLMFVPNLIIKLLPFIIFISTMWYLASINKNKELVTLKIFGFSNAKIIFLLALTSFLIGVIFLIFINPLTSSMLKYYEKEKSKFSRDVDHLLSINKNGVWIKERSKNNLNIIYAKEMKNNYLFDVTIYNFNTVNQNLVRLEAEAADISKSEWVLNKVSIYNSDSTQEILERTTYNYLSFYNVDKINTSYKNLDTISLMNLLNRYNDFVEDGYSENLLNKHLNSYFAIPVFLVLMVVMAAIFGLAHKRTVNNTYYIFVSIITCVLVYYFKDLSIALGQTNKISITLSVWMPIIAVGLFCSIGVIRLNEK